jgi:hypothetical protein
MNYFTQPTATLLGTHPTAGWSSGAFCVNVVIGGLSK